MLLASFFGTGHVPLAPGTAGTAAGFAILYIVRESTVLHFASIVTLFLIAFTVCGRAETLYGKKDHRSIVIDEVASSMLVLPAVFSALHWYHWLAGFVLFRVFDILKPPPARSFSRLEGSAGVVLDDVVAAVYAHLSLLVLIALQSAFT